MGSILKVIVFRFVGVLFLVIVFLILRGIFLGSGGSEIESSQLQAQELQQAVRTTSRYTTATATPGSFDQKVYELSETTPGLIRVHSYTSPVGGEFIYDPFTLMYGNICTFSDVYCNRGLR